MEQMIWLALWVLTELWLSAFETLMNVVAPLRKNVTHSSPHRMAASACCERRLRGQSHTPTVLKR
jgi:hypothetical protein